MRTVAMSTMQRSEPPALYGNIKVCKDAAIIQKVLGEEVYFKHYDEAAALLYPDVPEVALLYPVLYFNLVERGTLAFYDRMSLGSLDDDTTDNIRSHKIKLPDGNSDVFRQTSRLMNWV